MIQKIMEKINAIESRLESIERMLGDTISEPLWTTGTNPQTDKMVRVHINFGPVRHVGHISNDGIWTVYDLDGDKDKLETIKNYFGIVLSWRELTEEENTICWERGILGSSEEHAELSTLELPIAKQEPEWRPMELQKGNVIFTGGSKYVVRTPRSLEPTEKFICNRPHEDGDFSYLCGSDYCRCCS